MTPPAEGDGGATGPPAGSLTTGEAMALAGFLTGLDRAHIAAYAAVTVDSDGNLHTATSLPEGNLPKLLIAWLAGEIGAYGPVTNHQPDAHSLCESCWETRNPEQMPLKKFPADEERCCACGARHSSGIYAVCGVAPPCCDGHG